MMHVKIVQRPTGTAPDPIRDGWIGLTLPTLNTRPRQWRSFSMAQAGASRWQRIVDMVRGRTQRLSGYAVPARAAVDILAQSQPEAADWYRANAASLLKRRGYFLFDSQACEPIGGTTGGNIWLSQRYRRWFPASPGRIALIWAAATMIGIADTICFGNEEQRTVLATLYQSATPVFAGLLAAWVLRLRGSALHLLCALVSLDCALHLIGFAVKFAVAPDTVDAVDSALFGVQMFGTAALIGGGFRELRSPGRRVMAYLLAIAVSMGAMELAELNYDFWTLSQKVRPLIGRADPDDAADRAPDIEEDRLWEAQPDLLAHQIAGLRPRDAGKTNVYAIAVAASGGQELFGREARAALHAVATHFGATDRGGVLLSNAEADQLHTPLATRGSIAAAARAIAGIADRANDVLFVYLVSHGSRDAELASDLANYQSVQPISAASTAEALRAAPVDHRIIVVSACFAASWIPALANANTIVITAAAKDRTSFGCDDQRDMTVFGEAMIGSMGSPKVSLHDAFEDAKRKIAAEETKEHETPSQPQVYVGRNMAALWNSAPAQTR